MNPSNQQRQEENSFHGFEPVDGNFLYCPNQFFDVCLPNCSRGAVRIVAYMLRQTLGWLDRNGQPIQQEVTVKYSDIIQHARVSRGAARASIDEAIAKGFLEQVVQGRRKQSGRPAQSAVFQLRWSENAAYQSSLESFDGFYTGNGCRTPVPNQFFDGVVPHEKLNVVKVVGSVIRHTVGYQNQFGGRRSNAPLSHSYLEKYANISIGKAISDAVNTAIEKQYIDRVSAGRFSPVSTNREPAAYAIKWRQKNENPENGSKIPAAESHQFRNPSRIGSKSPAGDRSKNPSKEKTREKDTLKQQAAAENDNRKIILLRQQGFDRRSAERMAKDYSLESIQQQVDWLDARHPDNRVAMLRRAIEGDWSMPAALEVKEKNRRRRVREKQEDERKQNEFATLHLKKKQRSSRRADLISEWRSADPDQRRKWLAQAVKQETSESIIRIISRQHERTESPHMNVLNIIAEDRRLTPLYRQANVTSDRPAK